jgi:hypothetical protein
MTIVCDHSVLGQGCIVHAGAVVKQRSPFDALTEIDGLTCGRDRASVARSRPAAVSAFARRAARAVSGRSRLSTRSVGPGEHCGVDLHPPFSADDHVRGLRGAPVTLVVYGDYECPVSARLWRVLREMRAREASVCEGFRHFPLTGVHPHAFAAATAAEAAADQKSFWEMHDLLFEHQDALEPADLAEYATTLGLDVERFDEDVASGTFADAVRAQQRSGVGSGVVSTPTVFANGQRVDLQDPEQLPGKLLDLGRDSA